MDVLIELLNKHHDRDVFDCDNTDLNTYIKKYARQNQENNINKNFVATDPEQSSIHAKKKILGFYTLASGQVDYKNLPTSVKHPKYPVSIARLARLAVAKEHQNQGLGGFLLFDALHKIKIASELMGIYAVVVDAKDKNARNFYKRFGFMPLQESELTLFIPMSTIHEAVSLRRFAHAT